MGSSIDSYPRCVLAVPSSKDEKGMLCSGLTGGITSLHDNHATDELLMLSRCFLFGTNNQSLTWQNEHSLQRSRRKDLFYFVGFGLVFIIYDHINKYGGKK